LRRWHALAVIGWQRPGLAEFITVFTEVVVHKASLAQPGFGFQNLQFLLQPQPVLL
jgi:hypothetical protein